MVASQNPVLAVLGVLVTPARAMPWTWTQVPVGHYYPEEEPFGIYNSTAPSMATAGSQGILIDGTYVNWGLGAQGTRVQVTYLAGWPHTATTAVATAGADSLVVDDVTAWGGAAGWVSDGPNTETITVKSVVASEAPAYTAGLNYSPGQFVSLDGSNFQCLVPNGPTTANGVNAPTSGMTTSWWDANPPPAGPGTLNLNVGTLFEHQRTVLVTTMPPNLRFGVALFAKAQALQRGAAAMGMPSGGSGRGTGVLQTAIDAAMRDAAIEILPYRRPY